MERAVAIEPNSMMFVRRTRLVAFFICRLSFPPLIYRFGMSEPEPSPHGQPEDGPRRRSAGTRRGSEI